MQKASSSKANRRKQKGKDSLSFIFHTSSFNQPLTEIIMVKLMMAFFLFQEEHSEEEEILLPLQTIFICFRTHIMPLLFLQQSGTLYCIQVDYAQCILCINVLCSFSYCKSSSDQLPDLHYFHSQLVSFLQHQSPVCFLFIYLFMKHFYTRDICSALMLPGSLL